MLPTRQCVILVGGMGTRLGSLTETCPKPLLLVVGLPFLVWQIREIARFGFGQFLLLAGYKADVLEQRLAEHASALPANIKINILREATPLGTGGALKNALSALEEHFLLVNGDSLCLFNILTLCQNLPPHALARMALVPMQVTSRYGTVNVEGDNICGFTEKASTGANLAQHTTSGTSYLSLINAGLYMMHRKILDHIPDGKVSLEQEIFPSLAQSGKLLAHKTNAYFFLDIGIPKDFERAQTAIPQALHRPAVFFDRDGVLNHDKGYTHRIDDFCWINGARESILACNEAGYLVFVVTNQAGIAKGFYTEQKMHNLHYHMQQQLRNIGAHIDDFAFCPHHPQGSVPELSIPCKCRKPAPGMILDLAQRWNVRLCDSFLIGDKESDIQAAKAAGIAAHLFNGGNLLKLVKLHLGK